MAFGENYATQRGTNGKIESLTDILGNEVFKVFSNPSFRKVSNALCSQSGKLLFYEVFRITIKCTFSKTAKVREDNAKN